MNTFKKNLMYVYTVNLINGFAGIAFIPLAIYYLGAEGYGVYSIFVIITAYIHYVEMGISKYFTKTIAQANGINEQISSLQKMVGIYLRIALILILLTPLLMYLIPNFVFPTNNNYLIALLVVFASIDYLLSIPPTIQITYSIGRERFQNVSKYNLVSGLSRHTFLILTVVITKSVIVLVLMVLLRRIFDIFYARKYLLEIPDGGWKPSYKKGEFTNIVSQSIQISVAQLTQTLILSLGTVLVNRSFSLKEVGIYKSAFDMAAKVWFFSNSLGQVVFPRLASMLKDSSAKSKLMIKMPFYNSLSFIFFHIFYLGALVILSILPNFLLIQDFYLFFLILYGVCINAHTNLSYEFLVADSKMKEVLFVNIFTIINLVIVFYLFLNKFNFYSIGVSWIISQIIYSFAMDYFVLKNSAFKKRIKTFVVNILVLFLLVIFVKFVL